MASGTGFGTYSSLPVLSSAVKRGPGPVVATASSFLNTLGVNTHLGSPTYQNAATVITELNYIGFHNVREWAPAADNSNIVEWAALANDGIDFDFTIATGVNIPDYITRLDNFITQYPGTIKFAEGPNEIWNFPETYNGLTGMAAGDAIMRDLYAAVHGDAKLAGIPVVNLTTGGGTPDQTYQLLGNMQASVDLGNVHVYPAGGDPTPYNYLKANVPAQTSITTPNLSTVMTEAGFYTMPDGAYGVNLDVQANYTLDLLMDAELLGIQATYLYELIDEASDPGNTDPEYHFGLFNNDGSPKPVATALHNLTTILADSGDNAATGYGLTYSLSGLPSNGHSLQLVKASGADDIVVWAEPNIWNEATATETAPPVSTITVNLGATYKSVLVYDPTVGSAPIATQTNVSSVSLKVTDHPMVVEVASSTPTASSSTLPLSASSIAVTGVAPSNISVDEKPVNRSLAVSTLQDAGDGNVFTLTSNRVQDANQLQIQFLKDSLDGTTTSAAQPVTTSGATGGWQDIAPDAAVSAGSPDIGIQVIQEDTYRGSLSTDRNLYVNGADYYNTHYGTATATLYGDTTAHPV